MKEAFRVFVSVGSNIEREKNIRSGVSALQARFGSLTLSSVYESEAVGFAGDNFYNLVAAFTTGESLEQVIAALERIEDDHGRRRNAPRFGNRSLDLDILLYGDLIRHDGRVHLPRREITEYAFVLLPLAEIAEDLRHPEAGMSYRSLAQRFDDESQRLWKVDAFIALKE